MTSGTGRRFDLGRLTPSGRARVPVAWSLYDFANTIFSYAVVSTAMGIWLTEPDQLGEANGQALFSAAVIVSVGLNALVSPVLGAMSDRGGRRLPFLLFFTVLVIVPSSIIGFTPAVVGAILFTIANFAYQAALIFYDATLKTVSLPATRGRLSGIGVGVGYMGTITVGLLLAAAAVDVDLIFLVAGVLFAVFAVPIFLIVRERPTSDERFHVRDVPGAMGQLPQSIRDAREIPGLLRFLVARFFYSDAVNTIIVVMSVIAVRAMDMTTSQFLYVSVMLTVVAIVASFVWGRLVDRFGPKRTLLWVLASWAVGLILGGIAIGLGGSTEAPIPGVPVGIILFLIAGAIVGSGLGGVQVADRVFMIRLSPPAKLGEFFGLYGLVGKGSQVVGQSIYGLLVWMLFDSMGTGAYQVAVLTLIVTMLVGYWLIRPVSDRWGEIVPTDADDLAPVVPPERLAPMTAPLEPRG
ncbi:MAG TPA: MFS transporter [Candidatus Limnocylindrales bacterium]|jgi:UMF1 family MFS transporter